MKYSTKYLLMGLTAGLIIGIAIGYVLTQLPAFSPSSYKRLNVVTGAGGAVIEFDDRVYSFGYTPQNYYPNTDAIISLMTGSLSSKNYPATEGAVYQDFGIEFKVLEIHEDYVVLDVKSTVP